MLTAQPTRRRLLRTTVKFGLYVLAMWYVVFAVVLALVHTLHLAAGSFVLAGLLAWLGTRVGRFASQP
jgi:hypothetical protein